MLENDIVMCHLLPIYAALLNCTKAQSFTCIIFFYFILLVFWFSADTAYTYVLILIIFNNNYYNTADNTNST